jgi:predicted O-methyltransferase YrrM
MNFISEQDQSSVRCILDLFKSMAGKIYLEIGCAQLGTILQFKNILPQDGFVIGVDIREYPVWNEGGILHNFPESQVYLFDGGSHSWGTINKVKRILGDKQIDFLFIDGDHSVEAVRNDWADYSPMVRRGGVIAFHDVDWGAVDRGVFEGQGAAVKLRELMVEGYRVTPIPGVVGMAYVVQK